MNKSLLTVIYLAIILFTTIKLKANSQLDAILESIKNEQIRIDLIDHVNDQRVTLKSDIQSYQGTLIYLTHTQQIVDRIIGDRSLIIDQKIKQSQNILDILQKVNSKNVHFYTQFSPTIDLILKIQSVNDSKRIQTILQSNILPALQCIPFYINKNIAGSFLKIAAHIEPSAVLDHFKEFKSASFSTEVLDEVAQTAPMKIKTYLHSWNTIHQSIKASKNNITQVVYDIYEEVGPISRAYILLNDIVNHKISISKAHQIAKSDQSLFIYLIQMQSNGVIYAQHSSDEALKYQCLKKVNMINDLHEESDEIRFSILNEMKANEIYTLMVYSEDEIYTSTFLGMYHHLVPKIQNNSTYEFLFDLKFNRFRTFIKMCAGYNTLDDFLSKMGEYEKQKLFKNLVQQIEVINDNLSSAVTIVDTYGSIKSISTKLLFQDAILTYFNGLMYSDIEARKLYSSILSICNIDHDKESENFIQSKKQAFEILTLDRIFKDGKNVQQHFFFDDEDGRSSFNHFLRTFTTPNWRLEDFGTYIVIRSVKGSKIEIYANKPDSEYAGQDAIKQLFIESNRWPDIVVHRGHSYFVDAAIKSLTPNAEIVFLGSCGGYNIISEVLKYTPKAHIISSKQIGTMLVNDQLCFSMNEIIRRKENLNWEKLWNDLNSSFFKGSTAYERFQDYIPPHKNLGALLISSYQSIL